MKRIRNINLKNHTLFGNLSIDFTKNDGSSTNTILFVGGNGVGKSTLMNVLYSLLAPEQRDINGELIFDEDDVISTVNYSFKNGSLWASDTKTNTLVISDEYKI